MAMTLLEDFSDFTLWHDASYVCLYATWLGEHSGSLTRNRYNLIHQHIRQTGSSKLLNDSTEDENGWAEATSWLADEGFGRLADDGLQVVAWVLPHHPVALYSTVRVLALMRRPLVDTFIDAQAAYDWLHHWPAVALPVPAGRPPLTAAAFLLLPPAQQVALAKEQGRALAPRFEQAYYITPYELREVLRVDIYYHLHSGVFYQVITQSIV